MREEREQRSQYQNLLSQQGNSIDILTQRLDQLEADKLQLQHQKDEIERDFNNFRKDSNQEIKIIQKDLQALMTQKAHENLLDIISTVPGQGLDFDSMYKNKQLQQNCKKILGIFFLRSINRRTTLQTFNVGRRVSKSRNKKF